jgi:hypothetical protein
MDHWSLEGAAAEDDAGGVHPGGVGGILRPTQFHSGAASSVPCSSGDSGALRKWRSTAGSTRTPCSPRSTTTAVIKAEFDERKYLEKDYRTMVMKRSQKAMTTRWAIIHAQENMFHVYHHELKNRADSGNPR